ncbi:hypothetical protein [Duganella vulcania]|uniref:Uncharacterized protein n=1 Tax=Duganella vulcania TaxID=2692166 RepID=A0A845GG54_9BURK|nr:hypothetical protein [Duganella vulcania]MYM92365.1 hypothetical protein [Duganella vulcania]
MSDLYTIKQDGNYYNELQDLHTAINLADDFLGSMPGAEETTFTVENHEGYLMAVVTNRRIIGAFTKQQWGGRKGDEAIHIGEESFDATDTILLLPHKEIVELDDNDESSDEIGRLHVSWSGPFFVRIVDAVCAYFGVTDVEEITPEALAYAKARANPQQPKEQTVTLGFKLQLRVQPGASVHDCIQDMGCTFTSNSVGVVVLSSERIQPSQTDADEQAASQPTHYIGKLKERNGEQEYIHLFRFVADDPVRFIDNIASRFYDEDGGEQDGDGYAFESGAMVVTPAGYQEISRDLYVQLHGIVTGL